MTRRFAVAVVIATLALSTPLLPPPVRAQNDPVVLRVGDLSEMRTRNAIATTLGPFGNADEWGTGILRPVYSTPARAHDRINRRAEVHREVLEPHRQLERPDPDEDSARPKKAFKGFRA